MVWFGQFFFENYQIYDKPVKENDVVKKGDGLCYIESMKVMNAIKSEFSGKIQKIYFRDGEDVYDDDILFTIKK